MDKGIKNILSYIALISAIVTPFVTYTIFTKDLEADAEKALAKASSIEIRTQQHGEYLMKCQIDLAVANTEIKNLDKKILELDTKKQDRKIK